MLMNSDLALLFEPDPLVDFIQDLMGCWCTSFCFFSKRGGRRIQIAAVMALAVMQQEACTASQDSHPCVAIYTCHADWQVASLSRNSLGLLYPPGAG